MLDRKTMLTVLAFVLFMLAAAIWLVGLLVGHAFCSSGLRDDPRSRIAVAACARKGRSPGLDEIWKFFRDYLCGNLRGV
jgi:hypothetical protein